MNNVFTENKAQKIYVTKSGYLAAINEESYEKMMDFIIEKDKD